MPLEIRVRSSNGYLDKTIKGVKISAETTDSIKYKYEFENDQYNITIGKSKSNDLNLIYDNNSIPLSDKRNYIIRGEKIEIKRYDVGTPISHEGVTIYYIDNYGIISTKSEVWTRSTFFDNRDKLSLEILGELQKDTSEFYGVRPPPTL